MDAGHVNDDRWADRLSEYLDGELGGAERAALETHLASCQGCTVALQELRAVVAAAARLEDVPPERDLWAGIEARLSPAAEPAGRAPAVIPLARRRRFAFTLPQLAAAGIAVVALSSGAAWLVASWTASPATSPGSVAVANPPASGLTGAGAPAAALGGQEAREPVEPSSPAPLAPAEAGRGGARFVRSDAEVREADRQYDRAVADLERLLRSERGRLRPETVRALESSLADIDRAIADARRALAADPANLYLNDHLAASMQLKLELLRQATALAQS